MCVLLRYGYVSPTHQIGQECQAGLLFVDEDEAETFYNKLINRQTLSQKGRL
jgi:hypothetical protein